MTSWIERVENHPVHKALVEVESALSSAGAGFEEIEEYSVHFTRLEHVVAYTQRIVERLDPLLVRFQSLDAVHQKLSAVRDEVSAFQSTNNIGHLNNANSHADNLVLDLASLVIPTVPEDVDGMRKSLEMLHMAAKGSILDLSTLTEQGQLSVESLVTQTADIKEAIDKEKSRLDQVVSQYQQQFSEAQEVRQRDYSDERTRQSNVFEKEEGKRREVGLKTVGDQEEHFQALLNSYSTSNDDWLSSAKDDSQKLLNEIEERRNKAKELVGIIAGTGMAGGYQKDANAQKASFELWNKLTIGGFVGLIGFAIILFCLPVEDTKASLAKVAVRFLAILTFGLFTAYAGKMAMKHRESERDHRHKQLALESVNSFIDGLEPDIQNKVKQKMAEEFFTPPQNSLGSDHDIAPTTIDGLLKVVNRAIDKLGR